MASITLKLHHCLPSITSRSETYEARLPKVFISELLPSSSVRRLCSRRIRPLCQGIKSAAIVNSDEFLYSGCHTRSTRSEHTISTKLNNANILMLQTNSLIANDVVQNMNCNLYRYGGLLSCKYVCTRFLCPSL